jgi:hypothetical protein
VDKVHLHRVRRVPNQMFRAYKNTNKMTWWNLELLLTLPIFCPPVEMYLCKLVAVRKTSSSQNWCLSSTREKIKNHRTFEVLLRCRLCGELGCVAVIPEDCGCWLKVVVGEGKSREGGALQAYGYIYTGQLEGCRCLTGALDVYGALLISIASKLPVTWARVVLRKGNLLVMLYFLPAYL